MDLQREKGEILCHTVEDRLGNEEIPHAEVKNIVEWRLRQAGTRETVRRKG
jgi:hypothetical protein